MAPAPPAALPGAHREMSLSASDLRLNFQWGAPGLRLISSERTNSGADFQPRRGDQHREGRAIEDFLETLRQDHGEAGAVPAGALDAATFRSGDRGDVPGLIKTSELRLYGVDERHDAGGDVLQPIAVRPGAGVRRQGGPGVVQGAGGLPAAKASIASVPLRLRPTRGRKIVPADDDRQSDLPSERSEYYDIS